MNTINKNDGRMYNRKNKRDLALDMDLWIKWNDGNKEPLKLQKATDGKNEYELFYNGNRKERFSIIGENGKYNVSSDNLPQLKRLLKSWNSSAKWIK